MIYHAPLDLTRRRGPRRSYLWGQDHYLFWHKQHSAPFGPDDGQVSPDAMPDLSPKPPEYVTLGGPEGMLLTKSNNTEGAWHTYI